MEEGVGSTMIKKQDNPYDDRDASLMKIVAEIIRNMPGFQDAHITGFTRISPGPSLPPVVFRLAGSDAGRRLPYETIESDDFLFITAQLPSGIQNTPFVNIQPDELQIYVDERMATITLESPVDAARSSFSVRNRVLDIALKKLEEK